MFVPLPRLSENLCASAQVTAAICIEAAACPSKVHSEAQHQINFHLGSHIMVSSGSRKESFNRSLGRGPCFPPPVRSYCHGVCHPPTHAVGEPLHHGQRGEGLHMAPQPLPSQTALLHTGVSCLEKEASTRSHGKAESAGMLMVSTLPFFSLQDFAILGSS